MEIITKEVYKSGEHIFLNKVECEKYERCLIENEYRGEIINYLCSLGYREKNINSKNILFKKSNTFVYEVSFISDNFLIKKYTNSNEHIAYFNNKVEQNMTFNLCEISIFKSFYTLLNIE